MGGLSSWVLSGFTPRASQTSHVQLWPRGSGQEARHWSEHSWNAVGTFCACVCECVHLCGEALAHRRPTVIQCGRPFLEPPAPPPPPPLNSPPPHPLCPLVRHVLTQQPPQMHTQHICTHRHEHTHGFNQKGTHGPL